MKGNSLTTLVGFVFFALAYYLPLFARFDLLSIKDSRARALLHEALSQESVIIDLAINLGTHVALLVAAYLLAVLAARGLQRLVNLRYGIALMLAVISLLAVLGALNAALFPKSTFNIFYATITNPIVGTAAFSGLFFFSLFALYQIARRSSAWLLLTVAVGMISFSGFYASQVVGNTARENKRPNVILIGIDSLSHDTFVRYKENLPAMSALYDAAISAPDALTPVGRTFPAWIATLSGQSAAATGAYFNLTEIEAAQKAGLLSQAFKQQGYQTIFAIDERRFCNIDETYGFTDVIGPKPGVLDFALQGVNEMPLTNLLLQSGIGRFALKHSYMNTASHVNYDEDAIVREIARALDGRPLFMAVHFESAHFPFKTRNDEQPPVENNRFLRAHLGALHVVDRQVSALMDLLRGRRLLADSIVVLMSDHGEGFGEVETVVEMSPEPLVVKGFGHGNNLLSQQQNNIVLGFLQFKNGEVVNSPGSVDGPVSLLQVRPIIEHYLGEAKLQVEADKDCIPLETGLRFNAIADYRKIDREELLLEVAPYYKSAEDGRILINPKGLPKLVETKDVAVRCKDKITVYRHHINDLRTFRLAQGAISVTFSDSSALAAVEAYRARLHDVAEPQ